jgi:hypothetical protein
MLQSHLLGRWIMMVAGLVRAKEYIWNDGLAALVFAAQVHHIMTQQQPFLGWASSWSERS